MADEENLQVGGRAVHELRVVDLKKELEKRGLPKSGSKKELVERLKAQLLLEKCREMPVDEDDNVPNIATDEETSENEVIKEYMAERRRMFEQQKEARKKMEEEERRLSESAQESQVEQEEEPKPEPQSEPEPEPANHKEAVQEDDAAENEPDEPQVAREAEEPMVVDNKETEEKVELQEPLENHQEEKENKKDDLPEVPENVPEGDEEPPAKKGRKSRSRSSSRSKSRSSSSESRSRSRSPPPPKKRLSSSSASSRSASESKSRSRSRSRSRKESRSRSGSRSRSSSSSSDSESDHEDKPKIKGTVAVTPKVKEVARDDSYYTAPEDLSRDESNMEDSSKDVGQEEPMETSEVDKQDKDEESTGPAQPERQISMESSGGAAGKPARKRRWGSTRVPAKKNTFNISTDSLKGLIPEIKPSAISKEPLPDLGNGNDKEESEEEDEAFDKKDLKIQRTVIQDVKDEVMEQEAGETKTEAPPPPATEADQEADKSAAKIIRRVSRQTSGVMADEPQAARRSPSPARNPVSCIIHVRNLTRPYTLPQLKEVLGNLGTLVDEGFWIDKIKSHCYATYESEEHAQAARASLHGSRWPLSNPKLLRVDYASKDELEHHRNAELAPSMIKRKIEQDVKSEEADKGVREVRVKEDARPQQHVREWDRQKLRQSRSRSRDRERGRDRDRERRRSERSTERARSNERRLQERSRGREKERKGTEKKEEDDEPPAKLLDDLFCKTKATPCIYWLPLTDEQIVEKARELEKLNEERERRRKMREKAEEARRKREREDRRKQVQQQQQRTRDRSREHARQRSRSGSRSRRRR